MDRQGVQGAPRRREGGVSSDPGRKAGKWTEERPESWTTSLQRKQSATEAKGREVEFEKPEGKGQKWFCGASKLRITVSS